MYDPIVFEAILTKLQGGFAVSRDYIGDSFNWDKGIVLAHLDKLVKEKNVKRISHKFDGDTSPTYGYAITDKGVLSLNKKIHRAKVREAKAGQKWQRRFWISSTVRNWIAVLGFIYASIDIVLNLIYRKGLFQIVIDFLL